MNTNKHTTHKKQHQILFNKTENFLIMVLLYHFNTCGDCMLGKVHKQFYDIFVWSIRSALGHSKQNSYTFIFNLNSLCFYNHTCTRVCILNRILKN